MSASMDFEKDIAAHCPDEAKSKRVASGSNALKLDKNPGKINPVVQSVTWLDRWVARKMLETVGNPPVLLKLWDRSKALHPRDSTHN